MKSYALDNFIGKIERFSKLKSISSQVANDIGERGVEIAKEFYQSKPNVFVSAEKTQSPNKIKVVAQGNRIAFDEFGTGLVGKGTYQGKLPTETLQFESPKGHPQQTQGWEYNYENPLTKKDGKGWYYGGVYTQGQPARAQMYHTSQQLKGEMVDIAKNTIKGLVKE